MKKGLRQGRDKFTSINRIGSENTDDEFDSMLDPDTFGRAYLKGSNDPISKLSTFSHKRSYNDLVEIDSANGRS